MKKSTWFVFFVALSVVLVGCENPFSSSDSESSSTSTYSSYTPQTPTVNKLGNYFLSTAYPKLANINENNYNDPSKYSSFGLVVGDEQIIYEAASANVYYDAYLNAIAQGYSAADCAKTYDAHKKTVLVVVEMMKQFK